jgi:hypothetical protein
MPFIRSHLTTEIVFFKIRRYSLPINFWVHITLFFFVVVMNICRPRANFVFFTQFPISSQIYKYGTTNSMEQSLWEANNHWSQSRNALPFMEPSGSLPCSQQPATDHNPDPDAFSPHLPILFHKIHSIITLPPTPRFFEWSFPVRLSNEVIVCISDLSHAYYINMLRVHQVLFISSQTYECGI